jgi:hypothetical protein
MKQAQVAEVLQRLTDGVVKGGPYLTNQLALAAGPSAIRQQCNGNPGLQVDPQRTAAEAKMANGMRRKMPAG